MAYSVDLRKKVVEAFDKGKCISHIAKMFNVCRKIIYVWLKLRKETGSLNPKTGYQNGHSHSIKDYDEFKEFAEKNCHLTSQEMAEKWGKSHNITISRSAIKRALKKINFTFKKKRFIILKQTKKNAKIF